MALLTEQCSGALAAFAEAIRATETWQEWNSAQRALEADAALMQFLARYEELFAAMRDAKEQGGGLSGEQMAELAQVREGILSHPLYVRREDASEQLERLFQGMNVLLSKSLGVDFATTAAPVGRCCG